LLSFNSSIHDTKVTFMKSKSRMILPLVLLFSVPVWAQEPVAKIEISTQLGDHRVRPFETVVVQLHVYAERTDSQGTKQLVRIKRNPDSFRILEANGGWLSKPFLFQGNEVLSSDLKAGQPLAILLGSVETFVFQDSVLYTAPEKAGKYHVEISLAGQKAKAEIEVNPSFPSRRPPEKISFPPEPANRDPYFPLVEHYTPFIDQETWFTPKADYLTRFDYDGDWEGNNNWDSLDTGTSQAYVHYAVMETQTHWFLIYNFFHPRDYSDRCVVGTCHENDNEGIILTVAKDGSPFGRLQVMETLAHDNIYDFCANPRIRRGVHDIDGEVKFLDESHPIIFIESGGHGVYGSTSGRARVKNQTEFTAGTGVTYRYKGVAERPKHANDRNVGYALLPIYTQWWERSMEGRAEANTMFDDFFTYQPFGDRPGARIPRIGGAFLGHKEAANKAKPFWGWHDVLTQKKKVLATGQWGLDPAYGVSINLRFPASDPFSLDYVFNPYLAIKGVPQEATGATRTVPSPPTTIVAEAVRQRDSQKTAPRMSPPSFPPSIETGSSFLPEIIFQKKGDFNPLAKEGRLDLRLVVDGQIEVVIQGEHICYQVNSGRPPLDDGTEMTQPFPMISLKSFNFAKKDGRGSVQLLEKPSSANNYIVRIQIDDPKGGEDRYHLRLTWAR
jgi:hypothetical protein